MRGLPYKLSLSIELWEMWPGMLVSVKRAEAWAILIQLHWLFYMFPIVCNWDCMCSKLSSYSRYWWGSQWSDNHRLGISICHKSPAPFDFTIRIIQSVGSQCCSMCPCWYSVSILIVVSEKEVYCGGPCFGQFSPPKGEYCSTPRWVEAPHGQH